MSYCRWSSDDWRCDLYCYADVSGGYTTHVANNRVPDDIPRITASPAQGSAEEWLRQYRAQMDALEDCERTPIGLAYDGETFNDDTLEAFRDRLLMLRAAGYRFPDDVLDEIAEEIASVSESA